MSPDQDVKLDRLFAAYRDAIPDVEPSSNFLPNVWQQIEAKQSTSVEVKLDRLLAAYRNARPDVEPSPNFLPGIWQQIEAAKRSSWIFPLRHFALRLVAASALAVAILTGSAMLQTPHRTPDAEEMGASYVDLLTLASMDEDEGAMWRQAERSK
jgi:hypothetical protein